MNDEKNKILLGQKIFCGDDRNGWCMYVDRWDGEYFDEKNTRFLINNHKKKHIILILQRGGGAYLEF